ncbi:MAG: DUF6427 family protein [Bacteroidota bacterium]
MISAFFSKTKPINYAVLLSLNLFVFFGTFFYLNEFEVTQQQIWSGIGVAVALVMVLILLSYTVKARQLTANNSYGLFFFSLLMLLFFQAENDDTLVFCCFFVLLSLDRALAMKTERLEKEKVFESALWIFVASLFLNWALLFLIPLYITVATFHGRRFRIWLLPLASCFCVLVLYGTFILWFDQNKTMMELYYFEVPKAWPEIDLFVLTYLALSAVLVLLVFGKLGFRKHGRVLSLRLILVYLLVGWALVPLCGERGQNILMFTFFPTAIFLTNYIQTLKKYRWKEAFIVGSLLISILGFVLGRMQ